ncbi:MAG TPA: hypothetical protein VF141_08550, partial [Chryseolinea sp.]
MNNAIKYVILIGSLCYTHPLFCQNSKELAPGYYVVVAAYAKSRENVAQNFVEVLRLKGLSPSYGFNSSRNLYFVYLSYFNNLRESLQDMKHTRGLGEFTDAWVRVVHGDIGLKGNVSSTSPATASGPPATTEVSKAIDVSTETKPAAVDSEPASSLLPPGAPQVEVTENPPIKQYPVMTLGNTEVFLSLYNARNNRIVDGTVQVIDTDRARMITQVKGNEYLLLPDPKSKSGQLTLICEAFGYRKIQQEINYPLPLADTVKSYIDLMGTTLVINFDLVRYHKGDIATLYNVY